MTPEERKNLPKKRANRKEIDAFYGLAACLSFLMDAAGDDECDDEQKVPGALEDRAHLIPGGWRDLCLIRSKTKNLVRCMIHTFEPDKQRNIAKQMNHLRIKTVFGPEAAKDPEMFMLPIEDVGVLVRAATQGICKINMCPQAECARCQLGKVLDRCSFVTRCDRAWWEVFEQANYRDVGMEDAG